MNLQFSLLALLPLTAKAVNIVLSNDDGWAESNIRQFYYALTNAGNKVVISAPADNRSGTGSLDAPAIPLLSPCEFDSCPAGSPAEGTNRSMTNFNYVNSFPVTAMRYGIETLSPDRFAGGPDIAVAGFNVGANLGVSVPFSGTIGAAVAAVRMGIPGIAFSGTTGSQTAWDTPVQNYQTIYAGLATNVTQSIVASGMPYLPDNIWLNVNFPASTSTSCSKTSDFKFVLSRLYAASFISGDDVVTCNNSGRLPTENTVVDTDNCYASISLGTAGMKIDASADEQAVVLSKLSSILSCLP